MMPAAKHLDPLLGIDIHLIQPPGPVPPVPVPHPYTGLVFDPMDYVPLLGATVFIFGLPRAQAGTSGRSLPPHIPLGGVFVKPPANKSEIFMGSATVAADGEALSHLGLPALSCQDIGIPPVPRLKKKTTVASLVLPTTTVLSIPLPVLVGGPPTVSLMALGMRVSLALLGALVAKLKRMCAARKAENGVHCNGGHPVDVITGANFDDFLDVRSPPPGLFCWRRYYTTARASRHGPLGWGFRHEYQHTLHLHRQAWRYEDAQGRVIDFPPLAEGEQQTVRHGVVLRRQGPRRFEMKDRLVRVRRHGVVREEYTWDTGDRLVEKRDGQGQVLLRIVHGSGGRTATRHLSSGGRHLLEHDERGWPTRASTHRHEVVLRRDALGRLQHDLRNGRGVEHVQLGDTRWTTLFGRFTWKLEGREEAGDLRLTDPAGHLHRLRRGSTGLVLREHSNGTRELSQYDKEGRLCSSLAWKRAQDGALLSYWVRYEYTGEGDLVSAWHGEQGVTRYTVDAAHRLVQEKGPHGLFQYRLDAAGNLLEKPGLGGVVLAEGNRLAWANGELFTYGCRNHLSERRGPEGRCTRYLYDSADMLVRVEDGHGEPWTAEYDAIGRRLRCGRGGRQTEFSWEGERLAAEVSPEGRLRVYVYVAHDALVPVLFIDYDSADAEPEQGRVYTLYANQAGVPCRVEDASGRVVWWAERIDPYGHVEVGAGSELDLRLRWPGHYLDSDTGLFYNRFRYYDPVLGRYLQSDPLGLGGGLHLYGYAPNPLVQFDVLGLSHNKKTQANATSASNPPSTELPPGIKEQPLHNLLNGLSNFQGKNFQFGSQFFVLDKKGMKHILERHHPHYWRGESKKTQTFFDDHMSISDIQDAISDVLKQNRERLLQRGPKGMYQLAGISGGREYVLGINQGRIGQFYPLTQGGPT